MEREGASEAVPAGALGIAHRNSLTLVHGLFRTKQRQPQDASRFTTSSRARTPGAELKKAADFVSHTLRRMPK